MITNISLLAQTFQLTGSQLFWHESIKAIPVAIITAIGAGLGLLVGKRVAAYWALRQKRREIELTTLNEFYRLYGEFFAVWKLWNQHLKDKGHFPTSNKMPWHLLDRACTAESAMESILVKVASERELTHTDIDNLGLLRQAFQTLREKIRKNEKIDWRYDKHEQYATLKKLACSFSTMLISNADYRKPTAEVSSQQLMQITSNENEIRWEALLEKEKDKWKTK